MRKISLHARAESDLIDIWVYSFEEWDDLQADKYLDKLSAAINSLAGNPELGVSSSRKPGGSHCGSHSPSV